MRLLEAFWNWILTFVWVPEWGWHLYAGFQTLYVGERVAFIGLLVAVLLGAAAAANRFFMFDFAAPTDRAHVPKPRHDHGTGLKWLMLLVLALLPGGLVGSFVVYSIMGKEHWRREAYLIVLGSAIPAGLLALMRMPLFPYPNLRDTVSISGILGIVFALLQIWALIKLLRENWGEPDECVPWWPPLALWMQTLMLAGTMVYLTIAGTW